MSVIKSYLSPVENKHNANHDVGMSCTNGIGKHGK